MVRQSELVGKTSLPGKLRDLGNLGYVGRVGYLVIPAAQATYLCQLLATTWAYLGCLATWFTIAMLSGYLGYLTTQEI